MPAVLVEMLNNFNGARLFLRHVPLISIFGVSLIPPLSPMQWAEDWHIDKYTPSWRSFEQVLLIIFGTVGLAANRVLEPDGLGNFL